MPAEAELQVAAEGLADGWVRYDADAATAWAESLPDGPVRDVVAESISDWFLMGHPADAWRWAETITDPKMRAKAYSQVAIYWRTNVPEEFRAAHDKVPHLRHPRSAACFCSNGCFGVVRMPA